MKKAALTTLLIILATVAGADYRPVTMQSEFLQMLGGKQLTNRLYGLSISVQPSGQIAGNAMGWDITGSWTWQNGYFCREMAWGGDAIPYNCQLVEVNGDQMRFTVDQGAGDSASFRLR